MCVRCGLKPRWAVLRVYIPVGYCWISQWVHGGETDSICVREVDECLFGLYHSVAWQCLHCC